MYDGPPGIWSPNVPSSRMISRRSSPSNITNDAVAVANRRPAAHRRHHDLASAGRRRAQVVRGQRHGRPPDRLAHRPPGDRHQVAAVGVAADVPARLHLGSERRHRLSVGGFVRRDPTDCGCVGEDSGHRRNGTDAPHQRSPLRPRIVVADRCPVISSISSAAETHRWAGRGEPLACWRDPVLRDDPDLLRQCRAAPRPRVHHDRRRRADPLAPPARRRRQVPHRHRRARPEDPADRRGRRAVAAGVRRRHRTEVRRRLEAAEHRQRRLHPHHRTAPQGRGGRTPPALLRRRRHRTRHVRRQVLRRLRGVLRRRRTDRSGR